MKQVLSGLTFLILSTQSPLANALSNCFYQHVGTPSGYPYSFGQDTGIYLGDTQTVTSPPNGIINADWIDQTTQLEYKINTLDSEDGHYCHIETNVSQPSSNKLISHTIVDLQSACGSAAEFETLVEYPDSIIQAQLQNRTANQGPVYTGVELACFGN